MNERRAGHVRYANQPSTPTCSSGKRSYRNHREARKALRRIQSLGAIIDVRNTYRCTECDRYHLTSIRHQYTPHPAVAG